MNVPAPPEPHGTNRDAVQFDYHGRTAVVTGGASGLGEAACAAFARSGANVVVVDRDVRGTAVADHIIARGGRAIFVRADVSVAQDVAAYVHEAVDKFGRIDAFFNNAGILPALAPIVDLPDDEFDRAMSVNVRGVFLGLKYVLPVMYQQGSGAIVNTSSSSALVATPLGSAYIASKHAVIGLTKVASGEAGPNGVRVNAIMPTIVDTPMARALHARFSDPAGAADRYRGTIPLGAFPTPADIANLVLFLCSDAAASISGVQVPVDGGRAATAGSFAGAARP